MALGGLDRLDRAAAGGAVTADAPRTVPLRAVPASAGPEVAVRALRERGVVRVAGLVPRALVLAARRVTLDACRREGWLASRARATSAASGADATVRLPLPRPLARGDLVPVWRDVLPSAAVAALLGERGVVALVRAAVGDAATIGIGTVCRVVPPGVPRLTTGPHRDSDYLPDAAGLAVVWIPLGDCPRDLGGLAFLAGSHRREFRVRGAARRTVVVPRGAVWTTAGYRAGDVLLFDGRTVHRALPNATRDRLRISLDLRCATGARADDTVPG